MDGEIGQPAGMDGIELLQALTLWQGEGVTEVTHAVESNAPQGNPSELGEAASGWQGEAEKPYI